MVSSNNQKNRRAGAFGNMFDVLGEAADATDPAMSMPDQAPPPGIHTASPTIDQGTSMPAAVRAPAFRQPKSTRKNATPLATVPVSSKSNISGATVAKKQGAMSFPGGIPEVSNHV